MQGGDVEQNFDQGMPEMNFMEASVVNDSKVFGSASASKTKPYIFTPHKMNTDAIQRRSRALLGKIQEQPHLPGEITFNHITQTVRMEDEQHLPQRELAAKRFIDLLFLNGQGHVTLN